MIRALVIAPDGDVTLGPIEGDLQNLQGIVGGYIEPITPLVAGLFGGWHAYVNEEGLFDDAVLPNPLATAFARSIGWTGHQTLVGPVVFLGPAPDGEEGDVPELVVEYAAARGLIPTTTPND